jgi:hypothetical protein
MFKLSPESPFKSEKLRKLTLAGSILLGSAALNSCTIDSYHNDIGSVRCDDGRTKASFDEQTDELIFGVSDKTEQYSIYVEKGQMDGGNNYRITIKPARSGSQPVSRYDRESTDGSARPDFVFDAEGSTWNVDVLPKEEAVVVSGSCL